jgi:hypothetical protein
VKHVGMAPVKMNLFPFGTKLKDYLREVCPCEVKFVRVKAVYYYISCTCIKIIGGIELRNFVLEFSVSHTF